MFLPTTKSELNKLGWDKLDIILITGDTYIDSPYIGTSIIGKLLADAGYRVGVIAQPDQQSEKDITRLGEPELFWGVSGGSVDSMVANYTALMKKRKSDDFTPGGINDRRPDRAVIAYSNLIKRYFKKTKPIVLGGIEASLRRIAHYDYWSDSIRRSILFDSKADYLIYGMGEKPVLSLAYCLKTGGNPSNVKGICYIDNNPPKDYLLIESYDEVKKNKKAFSSMFKTFYDNNDPMTAKGLVQKTDTRYLIQNPPDLNPSQSELDKIYELNYTYDVHPYYKKQGKVKALDTIKFSLTTMRGCYGECNFCAISVHQGQTVHWRSEQSIIREVKNYTTMQNFKGNIHDVGGPTANMYGFECAKKLKKGVCIDKRCLYPTVCKTMKPDHSKQINLLQKISRIKGIKNVFVASGIRYDLILGDRKKGLEYLKQLVTKHTSGQLKVAPEHTDNKTLSLMGKPSQKSLLDFKKLFNRVVSKLDKKKYMTYYMIAAHPGCTDREMKDLKNFTSRELKMTPEQVQIFTPLPSTYSALIYHTERDPETGKKVFVEKRLKAKSIQKDILTSNK